MITISNKPKHLSYRSFANLFIKLQNRMFFIIAIHGSFPSHFNTGALVIEGSVKMNEEEVAQTDQFILFENEGESFNIEAMEKSVVLIISGKPIDEPIVAQGPFVMNTRGEIKEAIQDFNNGKFGYLND